MREHVVPARLEAVLGVDALEPPPRSRARAAISRADDADRRVIELGALVAPLLDDQVDAVALGHGGHPPAVLVPDSCVLGRYVLGCETC